MPNDILKTLDELERLESKIGIKFDANDVNFLVACRKELPRVSSALRRAMAVVEGLREMDFAEKLPDAKWAYNNSENDNAYVHGRRHGYAEVYRERDRLLSENGFKEED